jgi:AcrR family transcriptional regulator
VGSGARARDVHHRGTRARLIDAAARVFARAGFDGASVDAIAQEAGFTKGAVYSNFRSKDGLFVAVLEERVARRMRDIEEVFFSPESLEDVRSGGHELGRQLVAERDFWLLFIEVWSRAAREPALRERLAQLYERWCDDVGRMFATHFERLGLPLPGRPEALGSAAIALAEGHILQALIDPERAEPGAYGEMFSYLVLGFVAAGHELDIDAAQAARVEVTR